MAQFSIDEARADLPRLIDDALAGEDVVIAGRDTPAVRLVPVEAKPEQPRGKRTFGALKGKIAIDERFFEPLPDDELDAWEGR